MKKASIYKYSELIILTRNVEFYFSFRYLVYFNLKAWTKVKFNHKIVFSVSAYNVTEAIEYNEREVTKYYFEIPCERPDIEAEQYAFWVLV